MVYLKSIDAIGFKSFADHTNVQFDKGVTAIVGPNGSGKSNITDAIKWVLSNSLPNHYAVLKWKISFFQVLNIEKLKILLK